MQYSPYRHLKVEKEWVERKVTVEGGLLRQRSQLLSILDIMTELCLSGGQLSTLSVSSRLNDRVYAHPSEQSIGLR